MPALRTFIAAELPDEVKAGVASLQGELRRELRELAGEAPGGEAPRGQAPGGGVRWVSPERLHLTVKFLGDVPHHALDEIGRALTRAARGSRPFELTLGGLGSFGRRAPAVLWLALEGETARLQALHARLEEALGSLVPRDERPFRPHLTLARLPRGTAYGAHLARLTYQHRAPQPTTFRVDHLTLFKSELGPGGPRYTALHRAPLAADATPPSNGYE